VGPIQQNVARKFWAAASSVYTADRIRLGAYFKPIPYTFGDLGVVTGCSNKEFQT
jgi:hypothetical protein